MWCRLLALLQLLLLLGVFLRQLLRLLLVLLFYLLFFVSSAFCFSSFWWSWSCFCWSF